MRKIPKDMIVGTIHKTNTSGDLKVIKYENAKAVHVEFISTGYVTFTRSSHIRTGSVRDPLHPSVFGVGFIGEGKYNASKNKKCHSLWREIIERGFGESFKEKNPTYKSCTVHTEWHNFQNFAKWYKENYPNDGEKHELDKDLLSVGNKCYSSEYCLLIPQWLNVFTADCKSRRGDYPIGVSHFEGGGNFKSECSDNGKQKHLEFFSTPEAARMEWRRCKLVLALKLKPAMDTIDLRIYPNVVQIITEAR